MFEQELKNLGLSEKETKVYLAVLELGPETAQNIARKAGINRATTYVQIESLKIKGLMSEFEKGKKTFYAAETPERLLSLLNIFEKELNFKKGEIERVLPMLKELFAGSGERPKVRFFEGVEGTKALIDTFFKNINGDIYGFVNLDNLFRLFPEQEYSKEHTQKRIQQGIKSHMIYTRIAGPIENATDHEKLREAKFIKTELLNLNADISIDTKQVAIFTYSAKSVGIIIESEEIAKTLKAIFMLIWNSIET